MSHVNWYLKYISRYEDVFFYINIKKSYKREIIKDTKICVNHDGS
jgi:predicted RNA-binding protein with EMAP domain